MVLSYNDDFEVTWQDADAAASSWNHDALHFPDPLPLMNQELISELWKHSFGAETTCVNGYRYTRNLSLPPATPDEARRGVSDIWFNDYQHRVDAAAATTSSKIAKPHSPYCATPPTIPPAITAANPPTETNANVRTAIRWVGCSQATQL